MKVTKGILNGMIYKYGVNWTSMELKRKPLENHRKFRTGESWRGPGRPDEGYTGEGDRTTPWGNRRENLSKPPEKETIREIPGTTESEQGKPERRNRENKGKPEINTQEKKGDPENTN